MKAMSRTMIALGALATVLLAVGAASPSAASSKPVTISVASVIPGSTKEAVAQFDEQIKVFEKAHPNITVKPVQYQWLGSTFATLFASKKLPDMFTVPFTDARSYGDAGQLANLTPYVKKWSYFKDFNPAVLAEGTTAKGKIVGIPTAAYAQALHYNRKLFTQAGLDPNKPPTTWAQVRSYARTIAQKTGAAGYAQMGQSDNTAGWILTTVATSLGGRMEVGAGKRARATLNNPYTLQALSLLKSMRWTDNSMGSTFDYSWSPINQAFAAGKVGMFVSGSDIYTNLVQAYKVDPSIYGLATIPTASNATAAVMGGGTIAAVAPWVTDPAKLAAAAQWIDFFYMQPLVNKAAAIRNAKILVANKQPVGVPTFPIFNRKQYVQANKWIRPYFNVPRGQMAPFLTGIFAQKLSPEPPASTQAVYHALDPVVQSVLTDKGADVGDLLDQANDAAQNAISSGK